MGLKDAPIDTSFVPQVSCLNSQSCGNNQPNLFSKGPLHRVQLHHVTAHDILTPRPCRSAEVGDHFGTLLVRIACSITEK